MPEHFTLSDLERILRSAAGEPGVDGDISAVRFEDLGYDSVVLLEAGSLIKQEYGVDLADDALLEAGTPAALVEAVNKQRLSVGQG